MSQQYTASLNDSTTGSVGVSKIIKSAFTDQESLTWTPWLMFETWFKLLAINPLTGGFTFLLKIGPNVQAPIHGHIGAVEAIILDGVLAYNGDEGKTGDYLFEPSGIKHNPHTGAEGVLLFAVVHGPLIGYEEDGSIAAVIDAKVMYELAEASGQCPHIERPSAWDD